MSQVCTDHPYATLTPDVLLDAIESCGFQCDGTFLALNSYENRVYQIGIEDKQPIIAKFYRPDRWSNDIIIEEHEFAHTLSEHEISVVPPLRDENGHTLFEFQKFRFALFPRQGGYWPELNNTDDRLQFGRLMGRLHAISKLSAFEYRPQLSIDHFGVSSRTYLLENDFIPEHLLPAYESLTLDLLTQIRDRWHAAERFDLIRLHGDCHAGNILWTDEGPHFVDLDDCCMGPAIQDIWMLLSGEHDERIIQLEDYLEGYTEFCDFNPRELHLIEALRTLRMMHYSAWLARRWCDLAFPKHFPWFNTQRYWEDHVLSLREQAAAMNEAPLPWGQYGL
ncbi:MAG: serine/threonine protein kinase [Gammaproteobacteria bacterium]|nr:MAG: serine/threonine protein kinase [Gammaproteobacteria bacterium]